MIYYQPIDYYLGLGRLDEKDKQSSFLPMLKGNYTVRTSPFFSLSQIKIALNFEQFVINGTLFFTWQCLQITKAQKLHFIFRANVISEIFSIINLFKFQPSISVRCHSSFRLELWINDKPLNSDQELRLVFYQLCPTIDLMLKEEKDELDLPEELEQLSHQPFASDRLLNYISIMAQPNKDKSNCFQAEQLLLEANDIRVRKDTFTDKFHLSVRQTSLNCEVVVFEARWGTFEMLVNVLNVAANKNQYQRHHGIGGFGQIYKTKYRGDAFIIKCLYFNQQNKNIVRYASLREWFLLRISSALRIGPYLRKYIGFDLIFYRNCVDFAMEECTNPPIDPSKAKSLYSDLSLMHGFYIVHTDIKPENIMFSPTYQKCVFIDFGLSKIIVQTIGFKSWTRFSGSLSYATPEMAECFYSLSEKRVDLYYNDAHCLRESLLAMDINIQAVCREELASYGQVCQNQQSDSPLAVFEAKYWLFANQFQVLTKYWNTYFASTLMRLQKTKEIIVFSQQIMPNRKLNIFLRRFISESHKSSYEYIQGKERGFQREEEGENSEKKLYFLTYFNEICEFQVDFLITYRNAVKVREVIFDSQYCKYMAEVVYLKLYLTYINYFNNIYHATNKQRCEAARMFYLNFLKREPTLSDERPLIVSTIICSLQWVNNKDNIAPKYSQQIRQILLILPQFLVILDYGDKVLFQWLDRIYDHSCLNLEWRLILLCQIRDFQVLFRIRKSNDHSRRKTMERMLQWKGRRVQDMEKMNHTQTFQLLLRYLFRENSNKSKLIEQLIESKKVEREIETKRLRQIIKVTFLYRKNHDEIKQKGIGIYDQIREVTFPQNKNRIDSIYLFYYIFFIRQNVSQEFVLRWGQTLKDNINCPQIEQTFLLDAQTYFYKHFILKDSTNFTDDMVQIVLDKVLEYFSWIHEEDIDFQLEILIPILSKFVFWVEARPNSNCQIIKSRFNAFQKMLDLFNMAEKSLSDIYFSSCLNNHLYKRQYFSFLIQIESSLSYLQSRPINQQKVQRYIQFIDTIECSQCKRYKIIFESRERLRSIIIELAKAEERKKILLLQQSFIAEYRNISNKFKHKLEQFEYTYNIILLFFILDPSYEEKYHGLQQIYRTLKYCNSFQYYLKLPSQLSVVISKTLHTLFKIDRKQAIYFMERLTIIYRKLQSLSLYFIIIKNFVLFIDEQTTKDIEFMYEDIVNLKGNPYIFLYVHTFLNRYALNDARMLRKIKLKTIEHMNTFIAPVQTFMKSDIYFAEMSQYAQKAPPSKRKARFENNTFVKILMRCFQNTVKMPKLNQGQPRKREFLALIKKAQALNMGFKLAQQKFSYLFKFSQKANRNKHVKDER